MDELLLSWLLPIIYAIVGVILTWVLAVLKQRLGLDIEQRHRDTLQTALTNAAALLIRHAVSRGGMVGEPQIDESKMDIAVDYVHRAAPDAQRFFDIDDDSLMEKIFAKAGQLVR